MELMSDFELWMLLKQGEKPAFEFIYDRYFDDMYEYGYRMCKDDFILKDKIQDVFIRIWTRHGKLGDTGNIKGYLFSALRNSINEEHRSNALHHILLDKFRAGLPVNFSLELELLEKEGEQEKLKVLHNALSQISDRQKEIIYLRYLQDLDYEEVSKIMGITTKSAYKLSARALENLKNLMSANDKEILMLLFSLQISFLKN